MSPMKKYIAGSAYVSKVSIADVDRQKNEFLRTYSEDIGSGKHSSNWLY